MPPVLSIISGVPGRFKRRRSAIRRQRLGYGISRKSRRRGIGCASGFGNIFHCQTGKTNVDYASHHRLSARQIKRHRDINRIMNRYHVQKLKFRPTRIKKIQSIKSLKGIGNLFGASSMRTKCRSKKTVGRRIACSKRIPSNKCRSSGKRRVCKTASGKAFVRKDTMGRRHSSSGRFLPVLPGVGGLSAFKGDSCAHKVIRAGYSWKPKKHRRKRYGKGLGSFGFGAVTVPQSVRQFLPPINKETLTKSVSILGGAVAPITIQNMFVPVAWRTGIKGLLSYTLIGGGIIAASNRVGFMKSRAAEISQGVVFGFVFQILQNYVFKKSLIPAANPKAPTALKGVDACASCSNAGDCADIGSCLGYYDGVGDEVDGVGDEVDGVGDEVDGIGDDIENDLESVGDYLVLDN